MRKISLNTTQRDDLLRMCMKLFDEYKVIRWGKSYETDFIWMDNCPDPKPDPVEIHWFELCTVHLPLRLHTRLKIALNQVVKRNNPEDMELISKIEPKLLPSDVIHEMSIGKNPVDTIYQEYKKLIMGEINIRLFSSCEN